MATLVKVEYKVLMHQTDMGIAVQDSTKIKKTNRAGIEAPPKPRGNSSEAYGAAAIKLDKEYHSPTETHNPMELFATTVVYNPDDTLTIYDKTQSVSNSKLYVTNVFGYSKDEVRVESPFVGGGFGSGLRPQYQLFFAALAAKALKRSIRLTLTRDQMFTIGHRQYYLDLRRRPFEGRGWARAHWSDGRISQGQSRSRPGVCRVVQPERQWRDDRLDLGRGVGLS